MPTLNLRAREGQTRTCSYCREDLDGSLPDVECEGCGVVIHSECRDEAGRCPSIGCPGLWSDRFASLQPEAPRAPFDWRRVGGLLAGLVLLLPPAASALRDHLRLRSAARAEARLSDVDFLVRKLQRGSRAERIKARVGLIGLETRNLSALVNPLAYTGGWARQEAVVILRTKTKTPDALRELIGELHTTSYRARDLVVDALQSEPLPSFGEHEVRLLLEALETWSQGHQQLRPILSTHHVPDYVIRGALQRAQLPPHSPVRRAARACLRGR